MFAFAPAIDQQWGRWSPRVAAPVASAGCLTRTARLFAREHRRIRLAITGHLQAQLRPVAKARTASRLPRCGQGERGDAKPSVRQTFGTRRGEETRPGCLLQD